jgi:hypothetical protein
MGWEGEEVWRVSDVARLTEIRFQSNVSHKGCVSDPHLRIPSPNKNKFTANAVRKAPSSDAQWKSQTKPWSTDQKSIGSLHLSSALNPGVC